MILYRHVYKIVFSSVVLVHNHILSRLFYSSALCDVGVNRKF